MAESTTTITAKIDGQARKVTITPAAFKYAKSVYPDEIDSLTSYLNSADTLTEWIWIGRLIHEPDLTLQECFRQVALMDVPDQDALYQKVQARVGMVMKSYRGFMKDMYEAMGLTEETLKETITEVSKAGAKKAATEGNS